MDYLKLAKMLSVLGKIYRMGHISEAEYNEVKKKLLKEYNIF
ncbi:MAG: type II toxin-antitoxin system VapC family toxin [Lachnospiraceae bacterium]|nr:type II toxin-antitoxin system VapC family toxin [Lachnospiraceae bacterium]